MPVFTAKTPTAENVAGLRSYLAELVGYLRFLLENLDEDNIPALRRRTVTRTVLRSDGWKGDSSPYTLTLAIDGVTPDTLLAIVPSEDVKAEELDSFLKAGIIGGKQALGKVTLKAWGTKPETDIGVIAVVI